MLWWEIPTLGEEASGGICLCRKDTRAASLITKEVQDKTGMRYSVSPFRPVRVMKLVLSLAADKLNSKCHRDEWHRLQDRGHAN